MGQGIGVVTLGDCRHLARGGARVAVAISGQAAGGMGVIGRAPSAVLARRVTGPEQVSEQVSEQVWEQAGSMAGHRPSP